MPKETMSRQVSLNMSFIGVWISNLIMAVGEVFRQALAIGMGAIRINDTNRHPRHENYCRPVSCPKESPMSGNQRLRTLGRIAQRSRAPGTGG